MRGGFECGAVTGGSRTIRYYFCSRQRAPAEIHARAGERRSYLWRARIGNPRGCKEFRKITASSPEESGCAAPVVGFCFFPERSRLVRAF